MHMRLLSACQSTAACKFAIYNPPEELGDLINLLEAAITVYEREHPRAEQSAFFTDRQF